MADAQRVEIGFEGGQVISTRLSDGDVKDLRAREMNGCGASTQKRWP